MNELLTSAANLVHGDPIAPVIPGDTSIRLFAFIGRFIARRFGQPTVVGELLMAAIGQEDRRQARADNH